MSEEPDASKEKGNEILRQLREDTGSKRHLDQRIIRARAALQRAIEKRKREEYLTALAELGIDLNSEDGKRYLRDFDRLPSDRYPR
jgi:hypothetical protein